MGMPFTILLLAGPSALSPSDPKASDPTFAVREYLANHGLSCCVDEIVREPTWFRTGGNVDAISDVRFLTDKIIDSLSLPLVKRNVLRQLRQEEEEEATRLWKQRQRSMEPSFSFMYATIETLVRGFMLGFGGSFVYETLILSNDFYKTEKDLVRLTGCAALRATALGLAVALLMCGAAILVPNSLRHGWLQ